MSDRLANLHILITGAAGGIGSACARRLASEGAELLLTDINADGARALADELGQAWVAGDVSLGADIHRIVETAYARWGRLDVVFNNAGVARARPLLELTESEWDETHHINLRGVFFLLQAAARRMRQQDLIPGSELRGKFIQTASIAAFRGHDYLVHYSASKAGVVSITRTAANVLAADHITSNCICPGIVDTAMWARLDADLAELQGLPIGEAWRRRTAPIPLGRPERAEDLAGVVAFLASRDSDYMTGQAVIVDGGLV